MVVGAAAVASLADVVEHRLAVAAFQELMVVELPLVAFVANSVNYWEPMLLVVVPVPDRVLLCLRFDVVVHRLSVKK